MSDEIVGVAQSEPDPTAAPSAVATVPPPTYSAFGDQWPGPGRVASPTVLLAVALTAFAAAGLLGWERPGVGWFVTGLIGAVTVVVAAVRHAANAPQETDARGAGERLLRLAWAVLGLALLAASGLRAAEWLWLLCLPTAFVCFALSAIGGRSLASMVLGVLATPIAALRALPWIGRGFSGVRGRTTTSIIRVVAAVAVTIALLLIFGGLLAGADAVFASMVAKVLPAVDAGEVFRWIWNFVVVTLVMMAACFLALRPPRLGSEADPQARRRSLSRLEWGVPVGGLVLLFGGFIAVQAATLYGGDAYVQATADLTYAEYARQGFWQLLIVTMLTLVVLAVAARVAARTTASDRAWLRGLLGLLAVLTLLIVASATSRMWAYEQAYGYSRLRLLVTVCELWLGLVFLLVLVAGIRLRAPWLPQAVAISAAVALVGIVALNPDRFIAERNIARYEGPEHSIDLQYLSGLSADAAAAFDRLPANLRECVLVRINSELDRDTDRWHEWNLGRAQAREILATYRAPSGIRMKECDDHTSGWD